MWNDLPVKNKNEYKKMILAFAGLTEMFAQKAEDDSDKILTPIVNSKYQETVFTKVFGASQEDVGNTAYDAALRQILPSGKEMKYLIGLKTFGYSTPSQKVAQFKTNLTEWTDTLAQIRNNALSDDGSLKSKAEIDSVNNALYMELARKISELRNMRIDSAEANLQGFSVSIERDNVESVYHVLMPTVEDNTPIIHVGETSYDKVDVDNIEIHGCTSQKNPANFDFSDGNHTYRFTAADSQLYMNFDNKNIVHDSWEVKYAEDAYSIFKEVAERIYGVDKADAEIERIKAENTITESYSWKIARGDEVELFSGYNTFYGVGSKLGKDQRKRVIDNLRIEYEPIVPIDTLGKVCDGLKQYLFEPANNQNAKLAKVELRDRLMFYAKELGNPGFKADVAKLLYRPSNEMYIPVPNSVQFHYRHPDFFCKNLGTFIETSNGIGLNLNDDKTSRQFNLIFEPSGDVLRSYITQSSGKAIESVEKQTFLGEWILRGVFQLKEYEPLTIKKMSEVGINGIRLYKTKKSDDVHLQFIWIDDDNLPSDYADGEEFYKYDFENNDDYMMVAEEHTYNVIK